MTKPEKPPERPDNPLGNLLVSSGVVSVLHIIAGTPDLIPVSVFILWYAVYAGDLRFF